MMHMSGRNLRSGISNRPREGQSPEIAHHLCASSRGDNNRRGQQITKEEGKKIIKNLNFKIKKKRNNN